MLLPISSIIGYIFAMSSIFRPIGGWIVEYILKLDARSHGFAAGCFSMSDERFQIMCNLFAHSTLERLGSQTDLSALLLNGRHSEIIRRTIPRGAPGLRGLLSRAGRRAWPQSFYLELALVMTAGNRRCRAALMLVDEISPDTLAAIVQMHDDLIDHRIGQAVGNGRRARELAISYAYLKDRVPASFALAARLRSASSMERAGSVLRAACFAARLPTNPVPLTSVFSPITDGKMLRQVARDFRNCLREHILYSIAGMSAFAIGDIDGERAVIHLRRMENGWCLAGLHGINNASPSPSFRRKVISALVDLDVLSETNQEHTAWRSLRSLTEPWFLFDDELDNEMGAWRG